MMKIAYLSTYVPKKCGLATYTYHLRNAIQDVAKPGEVEDQVIAVQGPEERRAAYEQSLWMLRRDNPEDYERMAQRINTSSVDVVSLQHEFGIYGGNAGTYVLRLAQSVRKPLVTTFHTVFERPVSPYREIQEQLIAHSDHIIVMNRSAIHYLSAAFGVSEKKISYIPHGTPGPANKPQQALRKELGWQDRKVILTFGLIGPSKGIESILETLPAVVQRVPNVLYVIAGQTHPEIIKQQGEAYREKLKQLIQNYQLEGHVTMLDRYMSESDIIKLITACDLYVTPYPGMQQITSGTLAYAVGAGRPVLSTPYAYAEDLLHNMKSLLVAYGDIDQWATAIIRMLTDASIRQTYERKIQAIGQQMHWRTVGLEHLQLFHAIANRHDQAERSADLLVTR